MYVRQAASGAACLRERQPIPNIHTDFLRFTSKIVEHSRYLLTACGDTRGTPTCRKARKRTTTALPYDGTHVDVSVSHMVLARAGELSATVHACGSFALYLSSSL